MLGSPYIQQRFGQRQPMGMAQMAMGDPNQEILNMLQQQATMGQGPGMMQGLGQGIDATEQAYDVAQAMRGGMPMPQQPAAPGAQPQRPGGLLSLLGRMF